MPRITRKQKLKLEELPGLWDIIPDQDNDPMASIVREYRREQVTPDHTMTHEQIEEYRQTGRQRVEIEFISFGSGSSGNSAYIGVRGHGGVLIDAGVDFKFVVDELQRNCIPISGIEGIILTHDHSDHVRYAYSLLRKNNRMRLYCTPRTLSGILRRHSISRRIKDYHTPIYKEFEFQVGPLSITPFEVSHDGSDNVGFCIKTYEKAFVVATDMGVVSERADHYIRQANYLMIESNYDNEMLRVGRYPEYLKARIRSDRGHLCNDTTASYLAQIWNVDMSHILLCHLSQDNNTPEKALDTVTRSLKTLGITIGDGSGSSTANAANVQLAVLPRYKSSLHYIFRVL